MTVRLKLALTIFATGLATALLVIASVVVAFERFERETAYQRARSFLVRVTTQYDNLLDLQQRHPADFSAWLANLVLFEPDSQLYLLDTQGRVLATSAKIALAPDLRVAMAPVRESAGAAPSAYVMGDDPERMDADAVIAAQPLRRAQIHATDPVAGYLYLVCHPGGEVAASRWAAVRSSYGVPALMSIAAIVALMTALAAWLAASITRPLARLTGAVAAVSREGLEAGASKAVLPPGGKDEFGQLAGVFRQMLAKLNEQWTALARLDQFRREAVSNLSHDLRSPLTATVACLETLQARGATDAVADPELIEVALRNTRNAARLVQSLGDLARLDEPEFRLQPMTVDVGELLDDIVLRFAERARARRVTLCAAQPGAGATGWLDVELFERAVANLLDNALKFCRPGDAIDVNARVADGWLRVSVADTGPGIAAVELPQLFDRFFQGRQPDVQGAATPSAAGVGLGLGLAIVKRIAELHGGDVEVRSAPGQGTTVTLVFPVRPPPESGKP